MFLAGSDGNWARKVFDAFKTRDDFNIVALVLPTEKTSQQFACMKTWRISRWSLRDLTDYLAVERCVRGAKFVL